MYIQRFCQSKGTSLECAELIYVKTMETTCVSDHFKKKKKKKSNVLCQKGLHAGVAHAPGATARMVYAACMARVCDKCTTHFECVLLCVLV